jgi:Domain of unknown function (DUF4406)
MRGIKDFNFPAFHAAAAKLRAEGNHVFNPAEYDEQLYGNGFAESETGNLSDIEHFNLRHALHTDLTFICQTADAIALLPGWENSKGVAAELATAKAIGLEIIYL